MQPSEQNQAGVLRLNVWATTLSSAVTAVIVAILSVPLHLMHARAAYGERGASSAAGPGMMPHPMGADGGLTVGWIVIAFLVVLVYGGVAGAIFGAIYNAVLSRK